MFVREIVGDGARQRPASSHSHNPYGRGERNLFNAPQAPHLFTLTSYLLPNLRCHGEGGAAEHRGMGQSLPLEGSETATAVLNYSPVGCKTRGVTEPQRDRGTTMWWMRCRMHCIRLINSLSPSHCVTARLGSPGGLPFGVSPRGSRGKVMCIPHFPISQNLITKSIK